MVIIHINYKILECFNTLNPLIMSRCPHIKNEFGLEMVGVISTKRFNDLSTSYQSKTKEFVSPLLWRREIAVNSSNDQNRLKIVL